MYPIGSSSASKLAKELPPWLLNMLASPPRAGEGVNPWLFRAARQLHCHHTEEAICAILRRATADCGRRVSEQEIRRSVERSKECAWRPGASSPPPARQGECFPTPWLLPKLNEEQREAVISEGAGLVDLWEDSPLRFEDNEIHTEWIIDLLFPGNPLLCCGKTRKSFATRPREEWRGKEASHQFIVPSPMSAKTGLTQDGKESEHAISNTGPRRFLVIESDIGSIDDQAALLLHLAERWPLALVVHSGGKSLHGWFFCQGKSGESVQRLMRYAVSLGADQRTWTRSQFVRMPDGLRDNGKRQTIYFLNPKVLKP
jgi:hypothetical protein